MRRPRVSCAGVTPLTVPCVATGMNIGVLTTPWAVCKRARRAPEPSSVARTSNGTRSGSRTLLPRGGAVCDRAH